MHPERVGIGGTDTANHVQVFGDVTDIGCSGAIVGWAAGSHFDLIDADADH